MSSSQAAHRASQEAWRAVTDARHRDPYEIHVTDLHQGCLRQLHYRAGHVEPSDGDFGAAAMKISAHLGTAIDALYVPHFAAAWPKLDASITQSHHHYKLRLQRGDVAIIGESDAVAYCTGNTAQVWDLKTCEYSKWDQVAAGEIPDNNITQIICYSRLVELQTGRRVTAMHLYYLDRSDPEALKDFRRTARYFTATQAFNDEHRNLADTLFNRVFAAATSTTAAPRWFGDERGKISSRYSPCGKCPWQTRCLGKPVECEDGNAVLAVDAARDLVRGWREAKVEKKEAIAALKGFIKKHKDVHDTSKVEGKLDELAKDLGLEPGIWDLGDGLSVELRLAGGGMINDQKAMAKIITDAGHEIPKIPKSQHLTFRTHQASS
jgi:hypothetical protein